MPHSPIASLPHLPIDSHLPGVIEALVSHRAVVVVAAPGAGKTTRVPPALVEAGPVLVLQPRRVAARAIARRIADEQGWTVGREVGWIVRLDRCVSDETRLTLATEGVLTAMLHEDPLLSGVRTVVLDEFHERSVHADLGLALVKQAWTARDDLRVVVMSATMDAGQVSAFLGACPVVDVPGRLFPLEIVHRPDLAVPEAARQLAHQTRGAVLCFLPGTREIGEAARALAGCGLPVLPLHGGLDAEAQDLALQPVEGPRIVLATNLAETTVTVPDVTAVVDAGWHKVARYDAERGVDTLVTERIPVDSATQRAGRAGRTRRGVVYRLWDSRDRLRPHREPEILRVDLAGPVLDVVAWGGDPATFEWFDAPPARSVEAALTLLRRLRAVDAHGRLTSDGRAMRHLPLHPRLARLLLEGRRTARAASVCACLSEGVRLPAAVSGESRESDIDVFGDAATLPGHLRPMVQRLTRSTGDLSDEDLHRAVLAAYPDRVARRRRTGEERFLLASGTGAVLARESGVRRAGFIVAVEVSGSGTAGAEHRIRLASTVDPAWLQSTHTEVQHHVGAADGLVRAVEIERYDAIVLRERPVPADPEAAARLLAEAWHQRGPEERDEQLLRRLRFAGLAVDPVDLVARACVGATRLADVRLDPHLPGAVRAALARLAPESLTVPSGRSHPLRYHDDGSVELAVRLQEVFGLRETPRLGPQAVPVTFSLLAPNHRPVQVTRDLLSFWTRGYQEVRRELRGRYPRHHWPEDPWSTAPTFRVKFRKQ